MEEEEKKTLWSLPSESEHIPTDTRRHNARLSFSRGAPFFFFVERLQTIRLRVESFI